MRRAASAPNLLPAYQLRAIAGTSSASVYGIAWVMIDITGVGNWRMLRPRSPWKSETQKYQYCFHSGRSRLNARS